MKFKVSLTKDPFEGGNAFGLYFFYTRHGLLLQCFFLRSILSFCLTNDRPEVGA